MADENLPESLPSAMVMDDTLGEVVDENSLDLVPSGIISDDKEKNLTLEEVDDENSLDLLSGIVSNVEEPCLTQSCADSASATRLTEDQSSIDQLRRLHPFSMRTCARMKCTPRVKKTCRVGPRIKGMKSEEELNQYCTRCHEKGHICVFCPKPIIYRWWWDPVCRAHMEEYFQRKRAEEENQRKAEMQEEFYPQVSGGTSSEAESDNMSCDKPK